MTDKLKPCPAGHTAVRAAMCSGDVVSVVCDDCGWRVVGLGCVDRWDK